MDHRASWGLDVALHPVQRYHHAPSAQGRATRAVGVLVGLLPVEAIILGPTTR